MEKLGYLSSIKILSLAVLIAVLSPAIGNRAAWSPDHKNIRKASRLLDSRLILAALRNLNWLRYLATIDNSSPGAEAAELLSEESPKGTITSKIETIHAVIYGYEEAKIPSYLIANFDRIFKMVANYFNLKVGKNKVVVWVMDYQTLQKMNPRPDRTRVAALYAPGFHYFFFCPEFMKEYYIAHELIHYFMDAEREKVTTEVAQIIIRQKLAPFALQYYPDH